jgi:hypothetical protein
LAWFEYLGSLTLTETTADSPSRRSSPDRPPLAARARGNESMARHFERRAQADQSRALVGLVGEIAGVEQELEVLTPVERNPAAPAR